MIDCNAQPRQCVFIIKGVKDGTRAIVHYAARLSNRAAINTRRAACLRHLIILYWPGKTSETQPEESRLTGFYRNSPACWCNRHSFSYMIKIILVI
jgi:hypothetical protein